MKHFDENYKTNLYKTIENIESHSQAEIVVMVKKSSSHYKHVSLWFAFVFMIVVYSFFMFAPIEFNVYHMYFFVISSFLLSYFVHSLLDSFRSLFISRLAKQKSVEISARAIFQKAGIGHTKNRIGILFYVSLFEKIVYILPDSGAESAIPNAEWESMREDFASIFVTKNVASSLLEKLNAYKFVFNKYLHPIYNDINELADDLNIDL